MSSSRSRALFDGLGRTDAFLDRLRRLHGAVKKTYQSVFSRADSEWAASESEALRKSVGNLLGALAGVYQKRVERINFKDLACLAAEAMRLARVYEDRQLYIAKQEREVLPPADLAERQRQESCRDPDYEPYYVREFVRQLSLLEALLSAERRFSPTGPHWLF